MSMIQTKTEKIKNDIELYSELELFPDVKCLFLCCMASFTDSLRRFRADFIYPKVPKL